jgi:hypothetical protein
MTDTTATDAPPAEEPHKPGAALAPYRHDMHSIEMAPAAWQIAHRLAGTDFVPKALRDKPGAIMACIMYGHEIGVEPMQSLQKIHVIDGRPGMAAELMRALVLRAGHEIWFENMSSTAVTIIGRRRDQVRETKVTWTIDDADRAGLKGKDNWRKYPMDMLAARATGRLCRLMFAEVLAGLSDTIEELTDGELVDAGDIGVVADAVATGNVTPTGDVKTIKSRHSASRRKTAAAPAAEAPSSPAGPRPPLPGEDESDILDAEIVEPGEASDVTERPPESPQADPTPSDAPDTPPDWPGDPEPAPEDDGLRLSGPQMVAMKFGQKGITDRAIRLQMTSELIGRDITSGNDLSPAEVGIVLDALDDVSDAATVSPEVDAPSPTEPEPDAVRSGPASGSADALLSPEGWNGDQWRDLLQRRGIKASVTLKKARELSGGSVPTLDDIAGKGVAEELLEYIEDLAVGS